MRWRQQRRLFCDGISAVVCRLLWRLRYGAWSKRCYAASRLPWRRGVPSNVPARQLAGHDVCGRATRSSQVHRSVIIAYTSCIIHYERHVIGPMINENLDSLRGG